MENRKDQACSCPREWPPFRINPFMPTVPTFAVRETDVSRHNGGTSDAPLKTLRDDSALRTLSTLRGLKGAPEVPPLCRETQSLGQQMLKAPLGINGLMFGGLFTYSGIKTEGKLLTQSYSVHHFPVYVFQLISKLGKKYWCIST